MLTTWLEDLFYFFSVLKTSKLMHSVWFCGVCDVSEYDVEKFEVFFFITVPVSLVDRTRTVTVYD